MAMSPSHSIERKRHDSLVELSDSTVITVDRLVERNRIATEFISQYANKHAAMDVVVGLIGLFPGASIPALAGAIAAQSPVIYQPLARDLAKVYLVGPAKLEGAKENIIDGMDGLTGVLDLVADFGTEFMLQIASELLMEAGWGVLGAMFVPVIGGAVGAALDYLIATQMTWRVGTMVSIYFQDGGHWVEDQRHTFDLAKKLTGSIHVGITDLLNGNFKNHTPRADLNEIRQVVPTVRLNLIRTIRTIVDMLRAATDDDTIRDILRSRGIPIDLIHEVLG